VLFWLVATHVFPPSEIGLAAAAASAMLLCIQLALIGTDWAAIGLFPQFRSSPVPLVRASLTIVAVSGLCAGGSFLLLASQALDELSVVAATPFFAVAFLGACALGSVLLLADSLSIAMWRPDQILVRSFAVGAFTLGSLGVYTLLSSERSADRLFSCWLIGYAGAFAISAFYVNRAVSSWRGGSRSDRISVTRVLRAGLPNYALSLGEHAPGLVMPVVVAELLSPETNAYWYTIWLAAVSIYVIPGAAASALFAEVSDPSRPIGAAMRRSLAVSLGIGVLAASLLSALAPAVLAVLGDRYADAGATPLRILVLGVIPLTFFLAYLAVCRATRRFREALPVVAAVAAVALAGGTFAGVTHGLVGIASAWLTTHCAAGLWGTWRLRMIVRGIAQGPVERAELPAAGTLGP
jgi:O-antigen/teichoic acid export membrane protein